jgi:hypothetical protein
MAKAIPNPELPANSGNGKPRTFSEAAAVPEDKSANSALKLWDRTAPSSPDLEELLGNEANGPHLRDLQAHSADLSDLQAENGRLRSIIAELRQGQTGAGTKAEEDFSVRQKEYEALLDEKSELIRTLHLKIQELEARPVVPPTPKEEELIAMSEDLERERCQFQQSQRELEDLRKELEEDERIMAKQMREMEIQMARERADYARRRTELQRILDDIRREMENAERNGMLNQRLGQLRQRFLDVGTAPLGPAPEGSSPDFGQVSSKASPQPAAVDSLKKKDSGLLGRFFRLGSE